MKRSISIIIVLAVVLAGSSVWAADATLSMDLNSAYVWRGITINDGLVAQPSLNVSSNGFGFNVWGNYDVGDYNDTIDENDFSEVDLTASYTFSAGNLSFTGGVVYYAFPNTALESTTEIYGSIGSKIFGGLSAVADFYYDVDEVESFYADLGLAYAMDLTDRLILTAGVKAGFAGQDFAEYYSTAATDGGFYDYTFSLGLTCAVSKALSVGAKINYSDSMDEDVLPDAQVPNGIYGHDTGFYGGVTVAYTF
jgi:opacity protein-like surface antigen